MKESNEYKADVKKPENEKKGIVDAIIDVFKMLLDFCNKKDVKKREF